MGKHHPVQLLLVAAAAAVAAAAPSVQKTAAGWHHPVQLLLVAAAAAVAAAAPSVQKTAAGWGNTMVVEVVVIRNKGQKYHSLARSPLRLPGSADSLARSPLRLPGRLLALKQLRKNQPPGENTMPLKDELVPKPRQKTA